MKTRFYYLPLSAAQLRGGIGVLIASVVAAATVCLINYGEMAKSAPNWLLCEGTSFGRRNTAVDYVHEHAKEGQFFKLTRLGPF